MTTSELEKILTRIGFRLDGSKEKVKSNYMDDNIALLIYISGIFSLQMLMMFEDLAFGGVIFNKTRLKMKYLKYSDPYNEE